MQINQSNRFKKTYKKLHKNQLAYVNKAIQTITNNPETGELKKGDLSWLRVYKFSMLNQLALLGYNLNPELNTAVSNPEERVLTLIDLGSHENFYRDIKKQN